MSEMMGVTFDKDNNADSILIETKLSALKESSVENSDFLINMVMKK